MKVLWHTSIFDNLLSIPSCKGEPLSAPGVIYFCTSHHSVSWKQKIWHHYIPKYPSRVMVWQQSSLLPSWFSQQAPSMSSPICNEPWMGNLFSQMLSLPWHQPAGCSSPRCSCSCLGARSHPQHPVTAPRHKDNLRHQCLHHHHCSGHQQPSQRFLFSDVAAALFK